jgi:hypothetical protein
VVYDIKDYEFFAESSYKVISEGGRLVPYRFREANRLLLASRNRQLRERGFVRLLIVKARQLGISTEISGFYLHDNILVPCTSTHIHTHHSDTTDHLFDIVKTYVRHLPACLKPKIISDSNKTLIFGNESSYSLGTARSGSGGRGTTSQKFHGAETAFWENEDEQMTGILQTVHDVPGTEIMFESTGNGNKGMFYEQCMLALDGEGDYELLFLPWYLHPGYRRTPPEGFRLTEEEKQLSQVYNLSDAQLFWRRTKLANMGNKLWRFKQEFPINIQEAFQFPTGTFYDADLIASARRRDLNPQDYEHFPMVAGIDVSRNRDRSIIVFRQGRKIHSYFRISHGKIPDQVEAALNLLTKMKAEYTFIDYGYAPGFCDLVQKAGYPNVFPINFGGSASRPDMYLNKRAEMGFTFQEEMEKDNLDFPDDNALQKDLLMLKDVNDSSSGKRRLQSKDEIRKENKGMSSDILDGIFLTYAMKVCDTRDRRTKMTGGQVKRVTDSRPLPSQVRRRT